MTSTANTICWYRPVLTHMHWPLVGLVLKTLGWTRGFDGKGEGKKKESLHFGRRFL